MLLKAQRRGYTQKYAECRWCLAAGWVGGGTVDRWYPWKFKWTMCERQWRKQRFSSVQNWAVVCFHVFFPLYFSFQNWIFVKPATQVEAKGFKSDHYNFHHNTCTTGLLQPECRVLDANINPFWDIRVLSCRAPPKCASYINAYLPDETTIWHSDILGVFSVTVFGKWLNGMVNGVLVIVSVNGIWHTSYTLRYVDFLVFVR